MVDDFSGDGDVIVYKKNIAYVAALNCVCNNKLIFNLLTNGRRSSIILKGYSIVAELPLGFFKRKMPQCLGSIKMFQRVFMFSQPNT